MTTKLRLVLDVEYELNGTPVSHVHSLLKEVVKHAMAEGMITGNTAAEVEDYSSCVDQVGPETDKTESLISELEQTGNYRVARRFVPPEAYALPAGLENVLKTGMVIDTETTGLDPTVDKLMEVGYVMARFHPETGQVYDIVGRYSGIKDPGIPIPEFITRITGLVDADVAGKTLDRERILSDIAKADVIFAHNAGFDRGFLEAEFPEFANKWWACSSNEGPWSAMQTGSAKLEYLVYKVAGCFYEGHRALADAEVLLHLMTCKAHDCEPVLKHILTKSRAMTYRVWAVGAPFDKKDYLNFKRGFKWNDGTLPDRPIKAWFKNGIHGSDALAAELDDLSANVYAGPATVTVDKITGKERFTNRYKSRDQVALAKPKTPSTGKSAGMGM